ncbi:AraC-type DNA-binding domain-containing protein [Longilinea arvoryzae]|uniref:AraC-type DNA-binding domain-containing protein n=1 Tax=Longilinea arvoryzae TaxID=360412 RepID=A0A0S7BHT8_9CHLR|nr:helix-turn-helix domain-containing protein [Longilinea arvoryzae]GAP13098.1 AraC-type DNA-binding domain-containing protein [Longilinea arvoryzae]
MYDPLLQPSLDFIDRHLLDNPSLETIAAQSSYSLSHFYALFQASTGFTIRDYMRRRRLALAARELVTTRRRVLDIAVELGFESHETFTRAFRAVYGLAPNVYRRQRRDLLHYQNLDAFSAQMIERTPRPLEPVHVAVQVLERGPIHLMGMQVVTSVAENIDQHLIEHFIQDVFIPRSGEIHGRVAANVLYGMEVGDPYTDRLEHFTAFEVQEPARPPDGMRLRILPRQAYAVFSPERFLGPYDYSLLVRYAFGEWFPMSGRQFSGTFTMDVYYPNRLEVYVPLVGA